MNRLFAHWYKLLFEVVWLYGETLGQSAIVYYALSWCVHCVSGIMCSLTSFVSVCILTITNAAILRLNFSKLLFEKLEHHFAAPLSTTTDEAVAVKYCSWSGSDGLFLELVNGQGFEPCYFPTETFSKYPEEREYIFFGATV